MALCLSVPMCTYLHTSNVAFGTTCAMQCDQKVAFIQAKY